MSTNTKITSSFNSNNNENILSTNKKSYEDFIGYCALRKQFSRIIPSYYIEIQMQNNENRKQNNSSLEEYKKLKEEIKNVKQSIELLKESKQEKLKEIENLRNIMRKVGKKQISYKERKQINNNNIINYCSKEKGNNEQSLACRKVSSDEGLSLAPSTSGLSSGKDDDNWAGEGRCQPENDCNCSSDSWCFTHEDNNEKHLLNNPEQATSL